MRNAAISTAGGGTERSLILTVCLTQFCTAFMGSSLNVAIEAIAAEFAVQPQYTTWVIATFTVLSAAFLLCATAIAEYFGLLKVYRSACLLSALSSFALAIVPSFALLLAGRAVQGLIISLIFCTGMALLVARIRPQQRAFGIAVCTASVYAGLSLSPTLAGILTDHIGWRSIFVLAGAGLTLAFYFSLQLKPEAAQRKKTSVFDLTVSFFSVSLILIGLSLASDGAQDLKAAAAGFALLVVFVLRQRKAASPLLPAGLLRQNRQLRDALIASVFNYLSNFSVTFLLSLYFQFIAGYSASYTGLILMTQPVAMMLMSLASSRLLRYFSPQLMTSAGMLCIALAFAFFATIDAHTPLYQIMLAQFLTGFGFGIFSAPNTSLVMSSVQPAQYALVSSLQALSRNFGQACSMALATALLTHFISALAGTTLYLYELSYSINFIFICSCILAALGLLVCVHALKDHSWRAAHD